MQPVNIVTGAILAKSGQSQSALSHVPDWAFIVFPIVMLAYLVLIDFAARANEGKYGAKFVMVGLAALVALLTPFFIALLALPVLAIICK